MRAVVEPLAAARLLTFDAGYVEVAHEALFREWPRLRVWLEEHAAARAVQRRLVQAAAEWDDGGREPTELWRGGRLAAGVEFAAAYPDEVTTVERAFLDAGQAQARRGTPGGRGASGCGDQAEPAAALAARRIRRVPRPCSGRRWPRRKGAVAGRARVVAGRAGGPNGDGSGIGRIRGGEPEADPELAVLLAKRAVEHTREVDGSVLPEAEEALHRAVVSSRVVAAYPDLGGTLDWSSDGSMFVTEGPEGTGLVDVRDPDSGRSLRSWTGHDDDLNDVYFGPDGTLATTGDDGVAVAWDPRTGAEVGRIEGAARAVWGPSLSEDGSLLSAAWQEGGARVIDLRTGRLVREIGPGRSAAVDGAESGRDANRCRVGRTVGHGRGPATRSRAVPVRRLRLADRSARLEPRRPLDRGSRGRLIRGCGTPRPEHCGPCCAGTRSFTLFGSTGVRTRP